MPTPEVRVGLDTLIKALHAAVDANPLPVPQSPDSTLRDSLTLTAMFRAAIEFARAHDIPPGQVLLTAQTMVIYETQGKEAATRFAHECHASAKTILLMPEDEPSAVTH